jgi:hypothetical protein
MYAFGSHGTTKHCKHQRHGRRKGRAAAAVVVIAGAVAVEITRDNMMNHMMSHMKSLDTITVQPTEVEDMLPSPVSTAKAVDLTVGHPL